MSKKTSHGKAAPTASQTHAEAKKAVAKPLRRIVRPAKEKASQLSEAQRQDDIAVAAYYLAEKRGFAPDSELEDWLAAENQVARIYAFAS